MTPPPLLLLVEDDPTSLAFLRTTLRALPAVVDCASSLAEAALLASSRRYDLWLIDAHLPDGTGAQLLARLRHAGATAPALAHTATADEHVHAALRRSGFDEVITKPLAAARLQAVVLALLGAGGSASVTVTAAAAAAAASMVTSAVPVWDDAAAVAALNGNETHVAALRGLFLAELPESREAVVRAAQAGDRAALSAHLHRLRASCGFTGAARLAQAAAWLEAAGASAEAMAGFEAATEATLSASGSLRIARTW
jgi:DNA-binding response OmpR family regulator